MVKRALVVGSQTAGLEGPIGDAQQLASFLEHLAFEVDLRTTDEAASRDGILTGYRSLIDRTQQGDAAVVYYSGHGVRVLPSGEASVRPGSHAPAAVQAIVPTDFALSTPADFRGITDLELSVLLAKLTARTANATVILDCCHAAAMSRDAGARPKALLHPCYVDLASHIARTIASGLEVGLVAATGNFLAVRAVAAGPSQSAYERRVDGKVVGTFTESLVLALREAGGDRITWDAIGRSVRERVLGIHPGQRAEIEGPRRRYLFDVEEAPSAGAVTIVPGARPVQGVLRAGRLHGVHVGDSYAVVPGGAALDTTQAIATATITRVEVSTSTAMLSFVAPTTALPAGAQAVQATSAAAARAVELVADEPERTSIAKAIEQTMRFTINQRGDDPATLATVRLQAGQLELATPNGVPVVPPMPFSPPNLAKLATNLRMLTAAQSLRELASEPGQLPESAIEVTWGRVEHGEPVTLPAAGDVLAVGAKIFVRVTNRHPQQKKLYVSIFDIGVDQRIQLLTDGSGHELAPGQTFTFGESADGRLEGGKLDWSSELPEDAVRTEALVVIVTEAAVDLGALETPGATRAWEQIGRRSATSPLAQLVDQFQYGGTRDLKTSKRVPDGYLVHYLSFELSPWPLPAPGKHFLLDDRPARSVQLFAPRGAARASRKVAIRITGLVVHDTRSWFGSSNLRLDTLVITRADKHGDVPYRAETARFKNVKDGELLPLANALVYHGDVRDFIDFRVWVSRDLDESKTLTELLADQASSIEFKEAAGALLAVTAVAASAAPIVAAIGATATLTAIAWRVLSAALPKSIGLYQTSLLAAEGAGFGQGRHPPQGMFPAQGFSFGYEVVAV